MPARLRINSFVLIVLVALFVLTIHNLARLRITPFGLDPCDAVMHFAFFTMVLGLICSLRAFRTYPENHLSGEQDCHVLRSQYAVALPASVAFLAYLVSLGRHPSMWIRATWRPQLVEWLGVLACVVIAMDLVTLTVQTIHTELNRISRTRSILACALALMVMGFFPEYGIGTSSESSHILTVIVGALIVLMPMHYLLPVLVPDRGGEKMSQQALFSSMKERVSLLCGVSLGIFLFWIDGHRETAPHLLPMLKLFGPFMALFIIYAFVAEKLGIPPQRHAD